MQFTPYLNFAGSCAEAFTWYQSVLGGQLTMQTHGESPMAGHVPESWNDMIINARLDIGDAVLMASDTPPEQPHSAQGFAVSLSVTDPAEAERIFAAFADGGNVAMPMQSSFWAQRFGMVTDKYGTPWMVNCDL